MGGKTRMFITILGCSRIGRMLAEDLVVEGHNVTIVDKDSEELQALGSGFNGRIIEGIGIDEEVLVRAGIKEADIFIAVSEEDNINIMAAQIAKQLFNVKKVIARVYKGEINEFYEEQGIEIIHPFKDAADRIKNQIIYPKFQVIGELSDEKLLIIRVVASKSLSNRRVVDLDILGQLKIIHMKRKNSYFIPLPNEVIKEEDILTMSVKEDAIKVLERLM